MRGGQLVSMLSSIDIYATMHRTHRHVQGHFLKQSLFLCLLAFPYTRKQRFRSTKTKLLENACFSQCLCVDRKIRVLWFVSLCSFFPRDSQFTLSLILSTFYPSVTLRSNTTSVSVRTYDPPLRGGIVVVVVVVVPFPVRHRLMSWVCILMRTQFFS